MKSDLQEFSNALVTIASIEAEFKNPQNPKIDDNFKSKINRWSAGLFTLVVAGEIKKGKSSFINAMLGIKDLVPTSSDVATSTIFKICYGEELKYKVFFSLESKKECVVISKDEIAQYGTENGNPNNEKQVDFIQVFAPSPILQSGMIIIDTPGLGGLFKQHKRITYQYVPRADAVFLVTDSVESPIGAAELEFLSDVKKITPHVYFVQTKKASADTSARESRKRNNIEILKASGFDTKSLKYFMVDSKIRFEADETRDMEDLQFSGYPEVLAFINNDIRAKSQDLIRESAKQEILPKINIVVEELESKKRMIAADSKEQQEQIAKNIEDASTALKEWSTTGKRELQDKLAKGFKAIKNELADELEQLHPNGDIKHKLEQEIDGAANIEGLTNCLNVIKEYLPEKFSEQMCKIQKILQERATELLAEVSQSHSSEFSKDTSKLVPSVSSIDRVIKHIFDSQNDFEDIRTGLYGGMAGMAIASIAGGIIGSVIPVVGTIVGSSIGSIIASAWGSSAAMKAKEQRELLSAKQQAINSLTQVFADMHAKALKASSHMCDEIMDNVNKSFADFLEEQSKALMAKQEELQARKNATFEELNKQKKKLSMQQQAFQNALAIIQSK